MIIIRKAELSDLSEILEVFKDAIEYTCQNDYTPSQIEAWLQSAQKNDRWKKAVKNDFFILAIAENRVVGFASLQDKNHVDFMFVASDWLKKGIASLLFNRLYDHATLNNRKAMTAHVSITAKSFFERKGFHVITKNDNKIENEVLINYTMKKRIN